MSSTRQQLNVAESWIRSLSWRSSLNQFQGWLILQGTRVNPHMANLFSMTFVLVAGQKMGCEEADAMDVSVAAAQVRKRSDRDVSFSLAVRGFAGCSRCIVQESTNKIRWL